MRDIRYISMRNGRTSRQFSRTMQHMRNTRSDMGWYERPDRREIHAKQFHRTSEPLTKASGPTTAP